MRIASATLGLVVLSAFPTEVTVPHTQQSSPQTFRAGIEAVSIYATVRSADGALVPDLTRDDFEVRDNGTVREITIFSREIVPITVTVMLDMSGSQEAGVAWARDAANAFVNELLPVDRARIGTFGAEIAISPRLTSDKAYLRRVLEEEIWPGGGTPLWDALDRAMTSIAKEEGRRVVLAITDGYDNGAGGIFPSSSMFVTGSQSKGSSAATVGPGPDTRLASRIAREGFMVYAVGRRLPERQAPHLPVAELSHQIKVLAADSGGGFRVFSTQEDVNAAMAKVAEELHHQYLIGFTPAAIDNKVHRLDVRVKRSGMTAQARKTYLADGR